MKRFCSIDFVSFEASVPIALDELDAGKIFAGKKAILLKPNLVNDSPHPVTTSPDFCEAVIRYIRAFSDAEIVIGEGTGDPEIRYLCSD